MTAASATGHRTLDIAEVREKLHAAFVGQGMPPKEADAAADICLKAELLGKISHGVRLAANVAREYALGAERRGSVDIVAETPVSATIDAGFHCSLWAHRAAANLAATKAASCGIAIVSVKNAGVSGALGIHAESIARNGLVSLALNAAPAVVVAPGSAKAALGTNPLAIAAPRPDRDPVVLDMSTSAIAFNKVMTAMQSGQNLPSGVAVDAKGRPTRNPAEAVDETGRGRLLPFGGHRGFGLALMIEILVAGGVGHVIGADKRGPALADPTYFPGLYLAWKPELVGDKDQFQASAGNLLTELAEDGVRIPGEQSQQHRAETLDRGTINIAADSLEMLEWLQTGASA
jgi:LDH2 family malate/lactate/ureidoglycolate dehydrogenase